MILFLAPFAFLLSLIWIPLLTFGLSPFISFAVFSIPFTVYTLEKNFNLKNISLEYSLARVILISVGFALLAWGLVFFTHFGQNGDINTISSYMFLGTITSFFSLYYLTHHLLPQRLLKVTKKGISPRWSGYTMWLGYFLVLNFFGDAVQDFRMFSISGFSIEVVKVICGILIIVTPYLYVNSIIKDSKEDNPEKNGKQDYDNLIYFIFFIVASYFAFYGLNGFHYVLDYHD